MDVLLPGMNPAIDAATCALVTSAMQSAVTDYAEVDYTHHEFLDFARANGMDEKLLEFLESRGDLAGASPAQWMRLSNVGQQDWHPELHEGVRRQISIFILGREAFDNYVVWVLEKAGVKNPRPNGTGGYSCDD